jgi:hypothetical protein
VQLPDSCHQLVQPKHPDHVLREGSIVFQFLTLCISEGNKLFKIHTITADVQNVSLLLLNNSVLKNMGLTVHVAVMAQHTPIF